MVCGPLPALISAEDPRGGLGDDVLGGGPVAVAMRHAIGGGKVSAPELAIRGGVAGPSEVEQRSVVDLVPGRLQLTHLRRHLEPFPINPAEATVATHRCPSGQSSGSPVRAAPAELPGTANLMHTPPPCRNSRSLTVRACHP